MAPLHFAELFLESGAPSAAAAPAEREMLQQRLVAMLEAGRKAWPALALSEADFIRTIALRAAGKGLEGLDRLHATDLYLACACATGDAASIATFDRLHLKPLPALLARKGVSADVAEEVVQSLRERLFVPSKDGARKISDYDGRGPLAAWVRVSAVRAVSNLRRDESNRAALLRNGSGPSAMTVLDPELALIQQRYGEVFRAALADAFAALDDEERSTLHLYFQGGLNLEAIARVLGISRATVGRRMISARTRVLEETLRLLGERISATPAELQSLLGVVRSKLDLSLGALL